MENNESGFYSVNFEAPKFGMKLNEEVNEIAMESALKYPGMVFVLSKQLPPPTEGILV